MRFEDFISQQTIGAAIEVHRHLGPGHLESLYHECLLHELALRDISFESEVRFPIKYKNLTTEYRYRADLIIAKTLLVEVKALAVVPEIAKAQVLTYLKLADLRLGLLINFNVPRLVDGVKRVVNGWTPEDADAQMLID